MTSASHHELLKLAAEVACELSLGQCEALAAQIALSDQPTTLRKVAGQRAPAAVAALGDAWVASDGATPSELASALRCAATAVKTVSSYEKVELLYTGPGSDQHRRNEQGLLEVIRGARQSLWIVSYVVGLGVDQVLAALDERSKAGVAVRLLLDHRVDNYGQTLSLLGQRASDCEVLVWPEKQREFEPGKVANLHAKCAVADGRQAFVSSANLTGWALQQNLEVGYLVTGGETPGRLQSHLDRLVADGHLELAEVQQPR